MQSLTQPGSGQSVITPVLVPPREFSDALAEWLLEARSAIRRDPVNADQYWYRFEKQFLGRGSLGLSDNEVGSGEFGLAHWQAGRVKNYVDANLTGQLSIVELASLARLSPSQFSKAFKITFGLSPHAYVLERRTARARVLMATTGQCLAQIALDCGFADQAHFCRVFRRLLGMSPSAWRRSRDRCPSDVCSSSE